MCVDCYIVYRFHVKKGLDSITHFHLTPSIRRQLPTYTQRKAFKHAIAQQNGVNSNSESRKLASLRTRDRSPISFGNKYFSAPRQTTIVDDKLTMRKQISSSNLLPEAGY